MCKQVTKNQNLPNISVIINSFLLCTNEWQLSSYFSSFSVNSQIIRFPNCHTIQNHRRSHTHTYINERKWTVYSETYVCIRCYCCITLFLLLKFSPSAWLLSSVPKHNYLHTTHTHVHIGVPADIYACLYMPMWLAERKVNARTLLFLNTLCCCELNRQQFFTPA